MELRDREFSADCAANGAPLGAAVAGGDVTTRIAEITGMIAMNIFLITPLLSGGRVAFVALSKLNPLQKLLVCFSRPNVRAPTLILEFSRSQNISESHRRSTLTGYCP